MATNEGVASQCEGGGLGTRDVSCGAPIGHVEGTRDGRPLHGNGVPLAKVQGTSVRHLHHHSSPRHVRVSNLVHKGKSL